MNINKGDQVRLKDGRTADVVDSWGVARNWYKLKINGVTDFVMESSIDSVLQRVIHEKKRGKKNDKNQQA